MTVDCPPSVDELATHAARSIKEAVGIKPEFDSETLPLVDHYLGGLSTANVEIVQLLCATTGAYFGETIRRQLGGSWDLAAADPVLWRFRLVSGLSFCPAGIVAEAITCGKDPVFTSDFDAPSLLRPHLENILQGMGEVSDQTYYSLCGRFDTLEHIHDALLATAAKLQKQSDAN